MVSFLFFWYNEQNYDRFIMRIFGEAVNSDIDSTPQNPLPKDDLHGVDGPKSGIGLVHRKVTNLYRDIDSEIDRERNDMLEKLKNQYPVMDQVFKRYNIATAEMPQWHDIQRNLTPEILDKALKLESPTLIMVPPTTYESKIVSIDNKRMKKQGETVVEWVTPKLFNRSGNQWKVAIVEGAQNVRRDPAIDRLLDNDKKAKAWISKYAEQGLDVMDDLDTYLTLAMKGFAEEKPIDTENVTILNAKRFEKEHPWSTPWTATASWFTRDNCLLLRGGKLMNSADGFQLRAVIWLDGI